MRTRLALAIALLALAPGAPALATQLTAREVVFLEVTDPYPGMLGLATRFISRGGAIYAVRPNAFDSSPSDPVGVAASYVEFPEFALKGYWVSSTSSCFSSTNCILATATNQPGRVVGGEFQFSPLGSWTRAIQYRVDAQAGTTLEYAYLTPPPGYPVPPSLSVHVKAIAINDGDVIAGWATHGSATVGRAPIWWPSPAAVGEELPRLSGADAGPFPVRINGAGIIIGVTGGSAPQRAAVWKPGSSGYSLALLGELPGGTSSRAYDIGYFGGIVGSSDDGSGTQVAVIWRPSGSTYSVTPLPVPPDGSCSAATAINTNGDIAGNCTFSSGAARGVVWHKLGGSYELLHELLPLAGHTRSVAYALDDDGQAGGGSGALNAERAVLWPVVAAAPVSVPALSRLGLLCLVAALSVATAATLRARSG